MNQENPRNQRPLVSVVMCAYNARIYIEDAVNSILNQTYDNWELIVSDDGSNDGTREWLRSMQPNPKIKLFFQEVNLGYVGNKNFGHRQATGTYITQLDNDDLCSPERLQKQVDAVLADKEVKIVGCGYYRIDDEGREYDQVGPAENILLPTGSIPQQYPFWYPSLLVHKSVFEEIGFFSTWFAGILGDDMYWTIKANEKYPILCLKDMMYMYRNNPGSITNVLNNERKLIMPTVLAEFYRQSKETGSDWLQQKNYGALKAYEQRLLNNRKLMSDFYKIWAAKAIDKQNFIEAKQLLKKSFVKSPANFKILRTAFYYFRKKSKYNKNNYNNAPDKKNGIVIVTFESLTKYSAGGIGRITYGLANYLHNQGEDVTFYTINKGPHTTTFKSKSVHWSTRYILLCVNFFFKSGLLTASRKRKFEELLFDYFLSKHILSGDYLISSTPFISRTLKKNKHNFKRVSLIPANPNENFIYNIYENELRLYGVGKYQDPYCDVLRLQHFNAGLKQIDQILSISPITTDSYTGSGKPVNFTKYIYLPQNSNLQAINNKKDKSATSLNFLYIAHSVLLKGLHRLIDEWKAANIKGAKLYIVGSLPKGYKKSFKIEFDSGLGIEYLGRVKDLKPIFDTIDVMIIPSLLDNEPTTAIESLQYNIPLLISTGCGYASMVSDFVPDAVFNIQNPGELAQRIREVSLDYPAFKKQFSLAFSYIQKGNFDYEVFYKSLYEKAIYHQRLEIA